MFDSLKNRVSANLKVTQLSYMIHPAQIVTFCRGLSPDDQAAVMKGIESTFKWMPVAQIAQSMFPTYYSGGVSPEALDLVMGGQVEGGVELMRQQNTYTPPPMYGFTAANQAALSFAWVVLNALQQQGRGSSEFVQSAPAQEPARFCSQCGRRLEPGARFCGGCGSRL